MTTAMYSNSSLDGLDEFNTTIEPPALCERNFGVTVDTIINFQNQADAILLVCTILSAFLQVYVMVVAVKHIRRKTSDKCMHVFLFSMTFADFLLTALCYPVELAPRATGFFSHVPRLLNQTMHISTWVALIASSSSLVFLNVDKLFYFRFPLRYGETFTRARAIILITASWVFSLLFVCFAWYTESFECVDDDCNTLAIFEKKTHIYAIFMIVVGVIPTLTCLVVSIYIMKIVSQHRKQLAEERALCATTTQSRSNSVFVTRMRTFYFIFMTTVFTAITLLPYRLVGMVRSINPGRSHDCATIFVFWIMMYMIYLNSIINPLLTVTVLPQYRVELTRTFFFRNSDPYKQKNGATTLTAATDL
uniref:G_PROTEIN_RECEP_F1_2 domain-containing protein n=1 Tax=Panagrellus redivivus TaxID=6233 RepID=A0A7E4UM77_PANRE